MAKYGRQRISPNSAGIDFREVPLADQIISPLRKICMNNDRSTSKFISLILRHKPEIIGITLDEHGWADVSVILFQGLTLSDFRSIPVRSGVCCSLRGIRGGE